jgi:hypothetical protein
MAEYYQTFHIFAEETSPTGKKYQIFSAEEFQVAGATEAEGRENLQRYIDSSILFAGIENLQIKHIKDP